MPDLIEGLGRVSVSTLALAHEGDLHPRHRRPRVLGVLLDEALEEAENWQAERLAEGRPSPNVNGAVATGRILFGAVGDETRLEYTVIGDAVNLSAKLEKANKELGVRAVCDAATYDLARQQGYRPDEEKSRHPHVEIAGLARPLDIVVMTP